MVTHALFPIRLMSKCNQIANSLGTKVSLHTKNYDINKQPKTLLDTTGYSAIQPQNPLLVHLKNTYMFLNSRLLLHGTRALFSIRLMSKCNQIVNS